jgi:hypothetical protein
VDYWGRLSFVTELPESERNRLVNEIRRFRLAASDMNQVAGAAQTPKALIEEAGGTFVDASVIVDQLPADVRRELHTFAALVHRDALGPSGKS